MYGCCGLGQDGTLPPGAVGTDAYGDPIDADGNVLNPDGSVYTGSITSTSMANVTAGQLSTVANGGSTGNSSTDAQIAALLTAAGGATKAILQQVQAGSIASNIPLSNIAALQGVLYGTQPSLTSSLNNAFATLTANPVLLIGGAAVLFLLMRRRS